MMRPIAPQTDNKQDKSKGQELRRSPQEATTSKVVDQSLRERQQEKNDRRKQKEMSRAQQLADSDNEQSYEAEKLRRRQEEENRRLKKKREFENRKVSEDVQGRQQDNGTASRQVNDRNKNCSTTHYCRYVKVVGS